MREHTQSRRSFLSLLPAAVVAFLGGRPAAAAQPQARGGRFQHPDPRPGVDASRVVPADKLDRELAAIFDGVREIPHVVDGIQCYCGCAEVPDHYSLLSCYEADGMAQVCAICKGEGRLVARLHRQGKSLNEIRAAIDAEFG
jgi:hypothetical protein